MVAWAASASAEAGAGGDLCCSAAVHEMSAAKERDVRPARCQHASRSWPAAVSAQLGTRHLCTLTLQIVHVPHRPNLDGTGSFRDIVEYPTTIGIKIIGLNEGDFVQDMLNVCREVTKQKAEDVEVKWRDKGKYRAITINLTFQDADMVYATYAAINKDPRVKFKL